MNTAEIITAALDYNSEFPEAAAEINAGTPFVDVCAVATGRGWQVRIVTTYGVRLAGGRFAAAADPEVREVPRRDGRLSAVEVARRATSTLRKTTTVPVEYRTVGVA